MAGRTLIVGDVHGCVDELNELLGPRAAAVTAADTVVFVGDLVDKGPSSAAVVARARGLRADPGCTVVLVEGNHEERLMRWRRHAAVEAAGGRKNPMAGGRAGYDDPAETLARLSNEDLAFLEEAVLWHSLPANQVPGGRGLVLHGGVPPTLERLIPFDELAALSGAKQSRWRNVVRTRFVDPETGRAVKLSDVGPDHVLWAELYDGRFGHVWFGHHAFLPPEGALPTTPAAFPHATGLDLGCVYGGHLAAAVLSDGGEPTFVTVPAGRAYASSLDPC